MPGDLPDSMNAENTRNSLEGRMQGAGLELSRTGHTQLELRKGEFEPLIINSVRNLLEQSSSVESFDKVSVSVEHGRSKQVPEGLTVDGEGSFKDSSEVALSGPVSVSLKTIEGTLSPQVNIGTQYDQEMRKSYYRRVKATIPGLDNQDDESSLQTVTTSKLAARMGIDPEKVKDLKANYSLGFDEKNGDFLSVELSDKNFTNQTSGQVDQEFDNSSKTPIVVGSGTAEDVNDTHAGNEILDELTIPSFLRERRVAQPKPVDTPPTPESFSETNVKDEGQPAEAPPIQTEEKEDKSEEPEPKAEERKEVQSTAIKDVSGVETPPTPPPNYEGGESVSGVETNLVLAGNKLEREGEVTIELSPEDTTHLLGLSLESQLLFVPVEIEGETEYIRIASTEANSTFVEKTNRDLISFEGKGSLRVNSSEKGDVYEEILFGVENGKLVAEEINLGSKDPALTETLDALKTKLIEANDPDFSTQLNNNFEEWLLDKMFVYSRPVKTTLSIGEKEGKDGKKHKVLIANVVPSLKTTESEVKKPREQPVEHPSANDMTPPIPPDFVPFEAEDGVRPEETQPAQPEKKEEKSEESKSNEEERKEVEKKKVNPIEYFEGSKKRERVSLLDREDSTSVSEHLNKFLDDKSEETNYKEAQLMWMELGGGGTARAIVQVVKDNLPKVIEKNDHDLEAYTVAEIVKLSGQDIDPKKVADYLDMVKLLLAAKQIDPEAKGVVKASEALLLEGVPG